MRDKKSRELVAYAVAFVSFILPKVDVDEIILFGSVARGEADKDSDVDLFLNVKTNADRLKEIVKGELDRFYKSKLYETFELKGIKNSIKFEVGDLDNWKLKRSVISDGLVLYGKYKEVPEKLKGFVYFNINPIKNIAKRNKVIRALFGRKEKGYASGGIVKAVGGRKLSASSFVVPLEKVVEIEKLLNSEKVDFVLFEVWSDQL